MRTLAYFYGLGNALALLAIYKVMGGPTVPEGGTTMAVAMALMVLPMFYIGFKELWMGVNELRSTPGEVEA